MMRRFRTDCSLLMIPLTTLSVTDLTVSLPNECPNTNAQHICPDAWRVFPSVREAHTFADTANDLVDADNDETAVITVNYLSNLEVN